MAERRKSGGGKGKARAGASLSIEQYEHKGKQRANNPPVGLVTPETDRACESPQLRDAFDFFGSRCA